jgi:hypothetical protein
MIVERDNVFEKDFWIAGTLLSYMRLKLHDKKVTFQYGSLCGKELTCLDIAQWYQKLGGTIEPDTEIEFRSYFSGNVYTRTALTNKMPETYLCEGSISCFIYQPSGQTDVISLSAYRDTTRGAMDSSIGVHRNMFLQYEITGLAPNHTDEIPNRHIPSKEDVIIKASVDNMDIKKVVLKHISESRK